MTFSLRYSSRAALTAASFLVAIVAALSSTPAGGGAAAALAATTVCSSPQFSRVVTPHPDGLDGYLFGVATVPASTTAWAVGWEDSNNLTIGLAEHFSAGKWHQVATPQPSMFVQLLGVSAVSADNAWAVGADAENFQPLVEHWNGVKWSVIPSPTLAIGGQLNAVVALISSDVWAAGLQETSVMGAPLIEHWNGVKWSVVPVVDPFPGSENDMPLTAIARVPGTQRLWAIGPFLSYQWSGGTWTYKPLPGYASVKSLAIPAQRDVWAVGPSSTQSGISEHFNGTAWQKQFVRGFSFGAIASVSASDVWTAGANSSFPAAFARRVGSSWKVSGSVSGTSRIQAMTLRSTGSGWAVGETATSGQPQIVKLCGL